MRYERRQSAMPVCKGFSAGAIGRKDKQDAQVISEQFLSFNFSKKKEQGVKQVHIGDKLLYEWTL